MKLILTSICLIFTIIGPFKGFRGEYTIKGKAYINKIELVRNKLIQVEFGDRIERIKTNLKGEYFITIDYEYPCPTAIHEDILSKEQIQYIRNSFNPRHIFFEHRGRCFELENYCYKYDLSIENKKIFYCDLQF